MRDSIALRGYVDKYGFFSVLSMDEINVLCRLVSHYVNCVLFSFFSFSFIVYFAHDLIT